MVLTFSPDRWQSVTCHMTFNYAIDDVELEFRRSQSRACQCSSGFSNGTDPSERLIIYPDTAVGVRALQCNTTTRHSLCLVANFFLCHAKYGTSSQYRRYFRLPIFQEYRPDFLVSSISIERVLDFASLQSQRSQAHESIF